ncbi:hypothetical protein MMAN_52960 [Mycobacterium mantenii]|uniref:Uncharacterized protein n=1 Tax=Mycobacterium mantenii TaxID=560555 RepID=A0ABM7JZY5_MYCNT|nr:hypothetical protein MMAN_52960 [Mycobacterium mantenii]
MAADAASVKTAASLSRVDCSTVMTTADDAERRSDVGVPPAAKRLGGKEAVQS